MVAHAECDCPLRHPGSRGPDLPCPIWGLARGGCWSLVCGAALPSRSRLRAPEGLELPRPGQRHVSLQEVFLAFSLTECFQISLLLTSKENESGFFFFLPRESLLQNSKLSMIHVLGASKP